MKINTRFFCNFFCLTSRAGRFLAKIFGLAVFGVLVFGSLAVSCFDSRLAELREKRAKLRAYDGAPPVIPHELKEIGRQDCLHCHERGDATLGGKTATITPHPTFLNCRQCHLEKKEDGLFKKSDYVAFRITKTPAKAQPLGPPYIPHRLQNRKNCRACHLSATSNEAITPGHGERTNCRQCHVTQDTSAGSFP